MTRCEPLAQSVEQLPFKPLPRSSGLQRLQSESGLRPYPRSGIVAFRGRGPAAENRPLAVRDGRKSVESASVDIGKLAAAAARCARVVRAPGRPPRGARAPPPPRGARSAPPPAPPPRRPGPSPGAGGVRGRGGGGRGSVPVAPD